MYIWGEILVDMDMDITAKGYTTHTSPHITYKENMENSMSTK